MFLSYFLLCLIFIGIIICAVLLGKKLRAVKDSRTKADEALQAEGSDTV